VKLKMRGEPKTIPQRIWQHPRTRSRPDQSERCELQWNGCRPGTLADHNIDPKILHREIKHFLCGPCHAVDLIDKKYFAWHKRGEHRGKVTGVLDCRSTRHPQGVTTFFGNNHRERRFAESRRTSKKNVIGCSMLQSCRIQK